MSSKEHIPGHTAACRHGVLSRWVFILAAVTVSIACSWAVTTPTSTPAVLPALSGTSLPTSTPTPGITPSPSFFPTTTSTHTAAPTTLPADETHFTWDAIKNAAFPNEWASSGVAPLENGFYRQNPPEAATQVFFQLSHLRVYGDLDGDGTDDAITLLMVDPGGGTFYYLAPVLNRSGSAYPLATQLLGVRVFIRLMEIENGAIRLVVDRLGTNDYSCCPTDSWHLTYCIENEQLVLVDEVDLSDQPVAGRSEFVPLRIEFEPGMVSATIDGVIGFNQINDYLAGARSGQLMTVKVNSPREDVLLSIVGAKGGEVLASMLFETNVWSGVLPATQDYLISMVAVGEQTAYSLSIEITGDGSEQQADLSDPPHDDLSLPDEEQKVVYLTFDDGPSETWTAQILEVLARYNARATFFVLGEQAVQYPEIIAAELAGGNTLANHTYRHISLDGISRTGFEREVLDAETVLMGVGTHCLRPPYRALDVFTRAYAAELGYRVVLWDIDTGDWRRPGVTAIVARVQNQVKPGSIVLFHDGGGDRSQTVLALELILKMLSADGYIFEPVCR